MMFKVPGVLLIVAALVVLVSGACIDEIPGFEMKNGTVIPGGGYYRVINPEEDPIVKKIVADSIKWYNDAVDKPDIHFKDGDHYVAYFQINVESKPQWLKGTNYCCDFQMLSRVCTGFGKTLNLKCEYTKRHDCMVKAKDWPLPTLRPYKPRVTIDHKSLKCAGVPKPG